MRKKRYGRLGRKGFTLPEILAVVAIIAVLVIVAVPGILGYYQRIKITELDDSARTIFLAAQSELTAKKNAGEDLTGLSSEPIPAASGVTGNYYAVRAEDQLKEIVPKGSIDTELSENHYVVEIDPKSGVVYAVWYWENAKFEYATEAYDPVKTDKDERLSAGKLVGYYGGEDIDRPSVGQTPIPAVHVINAEELALTISVPQSSLVAGTSVQADITLISGGKEVQIIKDAQLTPDVASNTYTGRVALDTLKEKDYNTNNLANNLGEGMGKKFKNWVADATGACQITPGDDFDVEVCVHAHGTETYLPQYAYSRKVNSLFASVDMDTATATKTAKIAYGRHLQNLHDSGEHSAHPEYTSGVLSNNITEAEQIRDINFAAKNTTGKSENDIYYWSSTYQPPTGSTGAAAAAHTELISPLHPINNTKLISFDGKNHEIRNLYSVRDERGGLFSYIENGTYQNIRIVNPHMHAELDTATGYNPEDPTFVVEAGALVGEVGPRPESPTKDTTVTIKNCNVYNSYEEEKDPEKLNDLVDPDFVMDHMEVKGRTFKPDGTITGESGKELYVERLLDLPHIGAPATVSCSGGLVGHTMGDSNLTIENCGVSVINIGARYVGGLIGRAEGEVTIKKSYSGGFTYGNRNVGGLIGFADTDKDVTIENSYAAGEIMLGYEKGFRGAGLLHYKNEMTASALPTNIQVQNSYAAVKYVAAKISGTGSIIEGKADGVPKTSDNLFDEGNNTVGTISGTFLRDSKNYYVPQSGVQYGYYDHAASTAFYPSGQVVSSAEAFATLTGSPFTTANGWYERTAPDTTNPKGVTAPYRLMEDLKEADSLTIPYPYPMLLSDGATTPVTHYGDWLEETNDGIKLAYYEKYTDNTYGVYVAKVNADGTVTAVVNTLQSGNAVVADDGYRLVDTKAVTSCTIDGTTETLTQDTDVNLNTAIRGALGETETIYVYLIPTATALTGTNVYHTLKAGTQTFYYNDAFACEAFDVTGKATDLPPTDKWLTKPEAGGKPGGTGTAVSFKDDNSGADKTETKNVVIRSARQLANVAKYTNDITVAQGWNYVQLLDIDYTAYTGTGLTEGKGTAAPQTPAALTGVTYYGNHHTIQNLYLTSGTGNNAGLFGTATGDFTLDGIRLVNVSVNGGADGANVGGLVGLANGGTITDCGIYAENADKYENTFTIKSENTATTTSTGGLIGTATNCAISDSFAAVKVSGSGNAGGFAGTLTEGTVTDCYAGGHTVNGAYETGNANVSGATAGGFVGQVNGTAPTFSGICYSTCSVQGTTSVGQFAGGNITLTLGGDDILYATGAVEGTTKQTESYLKIGGAIPMATGSVTAHHYDDTLPSEYPYTTNLTAHYGDWVDPVMPAYVEKYQGGAYGVYVAQVDAAGDPHVVINTLQSDQVVVNDFYALISTQKIGSGLTSITDPETVKPDATTYYLYKMPASGTSADYYTTCTYNGSTFFYNNDFACEAFDVTAYVSAAVTTKLIKPEAGGKDAAAFEDSTKTKVKNTDDVVIRSARQLANVQKYTAEKETGRTWNYVQLLNIDFDQYTGTIAGGKTGTPKLTPARLEGGDYRGNNHLIQNLYIAHSATRSSGLFAAIGSNRTDSSDVSIVKDVTLCNVSVDGSATGGTAAGGLAGTLSGGKVENCGIYVENADDYENKWTVAGADKNGVGGLIGQITGGTVDSSYAAVRVQGTEAADPAAAGTNPVGGFVGNFKEGTISNCYAGGYVDKDSQTYESGSVNVSGNNYVGGFVGNVDPTNAKFDGGYIYSTASVGHGTSNGLFAGNGKIEPNTGTTLYAVGKAFNAAAVVAPRDESAYLTDLGAEAVTKTTVKTTNRYNKTGTDAYPYASSLTAHHGDWIQMDLLGVYYDTVQIAAAAGGTEDKTGYYANGNMLENLYVGTHANGETVADDGYMFLSTEDNLGDLAINVGGVSYPLEKDTKFTEKIFNGTTYKAAYKVPSGALNQETEDYYGVVSINGKMFTANFGFAAEIFDGNTAIDQRNTVREKNGLTYKETATAPGKEVPKTGVMIRSARQLANLGIRSNAGTYDATSHRMQYTRGAKTIQNLSYHQLLTIDYDEYDSAKLPKAAVLDGSNEHANHTPITLGTPDSTSATSGSFDGHEFVIRNLVPGQIRQVTAYTSAGAASEALIESGLFGRVTKGALKNIQLVNATVDNDASKAVDEGVTAPTGYTITAGNDKYFNAERLNESEVAGYSQGEHPYVAEGASENDGYFIIGIDSQAEITSKYPYLSYKKAIKISSTLEKGAHIKFTTAGPAEVTIWWRQDNNDGRLITIFDEDGTVIDKDGGKKDAYYTSTLHVNKAGTYRIHGTDGGNWIYRIQVHVTKNEMIKTMARSGALVGAVDPAGTTDKDVTIDNCGVYVEPENPPTVPNDKMSDGDRAKVSAEYDTAYTTYLVDNSGAVADAVGGLIGSASKGTKLINSFAAVKVTGQDYVGGFAGQLTDVYVKDCYSGGHTREGIYLTDPNSINITAKGTNGTAGGFVGQMEEQTAGTLQLEGICYSTASASAANVGSFAGSTKYAASQWKGYEKADEIYAIAPAQGTTRNDETYLDDTITVRAYETKMNATSYDIALLDNIYPYKTSEAQKKHHGDWSIRFNFVYYELYAEPSEPYPHKDSTGADVIEDNTINTKDTDALLDAKAPCIGFYSVYPSKVSASTGGSNEEILNTLRVDGEVYDSGYMIVSDSHAAAANLALTIRSFYLDSGQKKDLDVNHISIGTDAQGNEYTRDNPPPHDVDVIPEQMIDFAEMATKLGDASQKKCAEDISEKVGRYGYVIPFKGLQVPCSQEFYMEAYVNGLLYLYNSQFPCEVVNTDMAKRDSSGKWSIDYSSIRKKKGIHYIDQNGELQPKTEVEGIEGILIRTPWNLAGVARYTREGNTGLSGKKVKEANLYQLMDLNYGFYNPDKIYDGNTSNRTGSGTEHYHSGTGWAFPQIPAKLIDGKYEGYNHTIRNIYLANDSSDATYVGLFGELENATVQNLKFENVHINTKKATVKEEDTSGKEQDVDLPVNIGTLAAKVSGETTVKNIKINGVNFDFFKAPQAPQGDNPGGPDDKDTIVNTVGGAIGLLKGGTVENLSVNGVSMNLNNGTYWYKIDGEKVDVISASSNPGGYTKCPDSRMKSDSTPSIGGAIGQIEAETADSVTITDVTVTDPDIQANRGKDLKVGGFVGSADGFFADYSEEAESGNRGSSIENSGVYLSDEKVKEYNLTSKDAFDSTGVNATSANGTDKVGGFAGFLGKGVKVVKDFAAVRVQGRVNVGGFAGHIEGSHIEDCYSGGHTDEGKYSNTNYNVVAERTDAKAGGFAGWMEMAFKNSSKDASALYMTGVNYTTSSVQATNGTGGVFAGSFDNEKELSKKMGAKKPVNYAGGDLSANTKFLLENVLTGAIMPRQQKDSSFTTAKYDSSLAEPYPYKTNLEVHHGDWADYELNGVGYWEREDGHLRLRYLTSEDIFKSTYEPKHTVLETDAEDFDHESRDGKEITASGYFTVYSTTTGKTYTVDGTTGLTKNEDITSAIRNLLGGTTVAVQAYDLAKIDAGKDAPVQTWSFINEGTVTSTFYVNPAYALAINGSASTELGTEKNPYEIRTVQQLDNIERVSAANPTYFQQTHDIIADGYTSTTGNTVNGSFAGTYDGGMYRILDLDRPLFNEVADATLQHMVLYSQEGDATITTTGNAAVLALSAKGTTTTGTNINNCIVAGYTVTGSTNVGGLIAQIDEGNVTIRSCSATNALSGGTAVGGLVGHVAAAATVNIESSYAGGSIADITSTTAHVGGLVGQMDEATPPTAPKPVRYKDVYSYVDMNDLSGKTDITYYGIGAGTVVADSRISAYWDSGMPTKTADGTEMVDVSDADQMAGVSLAQIKLDTQKLTYVVEDKDNPGEQKIVQYDTEEYYEPNASDAAKGLENEVKSEATTEDKFGVFPFAAFAMDAAGNNTHYGAYPKPSYIGLYYYETEKVTSAASPDGVETYHFDVYGGEIYNGKLRSYELIDTLCRDHHLSGEYAGIEKSGYGYFLPKGAEADYTIEVVEAGKTYTVNGADMIPVISNRLEECKDDTVKKDLTKVLGALDVYGFAEGAFMQTWTMKEGTTGTSTPLIGSVEVDVNTAFAAAFDEPTTLGTDAHPYEIRTAAQLQNVKDYSIIPGGHYKQTHDVDGRSKNDYKPGTLNGTYDGGGYRILDLEITAADGAALFASAEANAEIRNVILYSPTESAKITSTNGNAAGLIAASDQNVTIENCIVSGYTITSSAVSGSVGGIAGSLTGAGTQITNCAAVVTLNGTGTNAKIGGIAGECMPGLADGISNCYAGGTITGTAANAGGIFGTGNNSTGVNTCYSYMDMTGVTAANVYALGNGGTGTFTDCYYLADTAHFPDGAHDQGTGCSNIGEMIEKIEVVQKTDYTYVPDSSNQMKGLTALVDDDRYAFEPVVKITLDPHVDTGVPESKEYYVHYGSWPEGLMAAGVAYVETDADGKIVGYQIDGYNKEGKKLDDTSVKPAGVSLDTLCTYHHDAGGTMQNKNTCIQDTYYVLFETRDAKFASTPEPAGDSVTDDSEVMRMRNAINTVLGANTSVTVYKTEKTEEKEGEAGLSANISIPGSASKSVYYTNGYAGVSYEKFSKDNPKQIRTVLQLDNIGSNGYFQQTHDLYGGSYLSYIGGSDVKGYDGQYYRIFDLNITAMSSSSDVGLFSQISGTISNVILYSTDGTAKITGEKVSSGKEEGCGTGGLVGFAYHGVTITNSAAVNNLKYEGSEENFGSVGGLVGGDDADGNSSSEMKIQNSYAGGTITIKSTYTHTFTGSTRTMESTAAGIAGYRTDSSNSTKPLRIENCYSYVDFSDVTCPNKYAIAACNYGSTNQVSNTYYYDPEGKLNGAANDKGEKKTKDELSADQAGTLFGTAPAGTFGTAAFTWSTGLTPATNPFPFPAVLKDENKKFVHYGILPKNP